LNVFALINLTRAIYPLLRAGHRPTLFNLGASAEPSHPEYQASKAALTGFTRAIQHDWSSQGIHILLMNEDFLLSSEKNHIHEAFQTRQEIWTLEAIHQRRHELVPNPAPGHPFGQDSTFHRFTPKFVRQWMQRVARPPVQPGQRLPHPHFAHKMHRAWKSGD
jgi:NAD(P)-dependent dehydrogenase (short-subunit alcohol dehydrogenase family)